MTTTITELDLYRLHRRARDDAQRTRYAGQWCPDPRRALARRIETEVRDRLTEKGYTVTRTGHNENFDLLAQGVRIEVKAARWLGGRYQAALRGNRADVLMLGCIDGGVSFFVIPFELVAGLTHIKISSHDPCDYIGRWTPYFEAWNLLDDLIACGVNAWQPMLNLT